jgi:tetratricopeptide (TPR) repeat protein
MNNGRWIILAYCLLAFFASPAPPWGGTSVAIASEQHSQADFSTPRSTKPFQDANTPSVPTTNKLIQSSFYVAPKVNSPVARQLRESTISALKSEDDERERTELQRLIEQVRSIRFEPKSRTPAPVITVEPSTRTEPNESLSVTQTMQQPTEEQEPGPKLDSLLPYQPVSEQTLQTLENPAQHPDQLHNPLQLAEILFLSGQLKQAAMFYQQALNRIDPNDVASAQDRAWILFQIGNCLHNDDLPTAKKMYRQLIVEYPNCPWADLAQIRESLIDWFVNDKPGNLIADCEF